MAQEKTFSEMVNDIGEELDCRSFALINNAYDEAEKILYDKGFDENTRFWDEEYLEEYLYQIADEIFGCLPDRLDGYIDKKQFVEDSKIDYSSDEVFGEDWYIID